MNKQCHGFSRQWTYQLKGCNIAHPPHQDKTCTGEDQDDELSTSGGGDMSAQADDLDEDEDDDNATYAYERDGPDLDQEQDCTHVQMTCNLKT